MSSLSIDDTVRHDVTEVLVRYATGIDRRDWALFRTCFTGDCDADYGDIGHWHGVDEITDWMTRTHEPCGHTLHRITNVAVSGGGADGGDGDRDRVRARSYVDALVLGADNRTGVRAAGFYDDELVRSEGGWRIARRRFTMVLAQPVGPQHDGDSGQ
jgi:3-phenylpropionate/cinnamic acid dioxygenase small subunit